MTAVDTHVRARLEVLTPTRPAPAAQRRRLAIRDLLRRHRLSLAVVTGLLVVAATVHAIGMFANPQVIDDEGTYVAQAWAVLHYGDLTHYTFWYDHPPLGWLQLAAYAGATGAFVRADGAVDAGREFMLVVQLVCVVLLWTLCRRLHLARWSSAVAVLIFAVSPLAVQFHRTVFLDNIAVAWLLAALVLAASPRRRLAELAGAAVCFAVAVLTKETFLLLAPAVGLLAWYSTDRTTRRYTLAVAVSLFLAIGSSYVLFAIIKGELTPGPDQVSLVDGIRFQLAGRDSGGSVFDPGSANRATVGLWLTLDRVTPVLALALTPVALFSRRLRPAAVGVGTLAVTLLRPGYLPVPLIIAALPLAAVVIAGVFDAAARRRPAGRFSPLLRGRRPFLPAVAILVAAAVIAAPLWALSLRGLFRSDPDRPVRAAEAWIEGNLTRDNRLMVDDAFWVDLVEAGFDRSNVVWAYKVDTDPAVAALSPRGWRDYDYVVVTQSMRRGTSPGGEVAKALSNSVAVARFSAIGIADTDVEVRRIVDDTAGRDPATAAEVAAADRTRRSAAGKDLAANPAVAATPAARDLLTGGEVDERLLTVLAGAASSYAVAIRDFPIVDGEQEVGLPRRVAIVVGRPLVTAPGTPDLLQWLRSQSGLPLVATPTPEGVALSVSPAAPSEARSLGAPDLPALTASEATP